MLLVLLTLLLCAATPAERRLIASVAGRTGWARTVNRSARGRHMHAGLIEKYRREADPDGLMSEEDRNKAGAALYRNHFDRMTQRSLKARREKRERLEREAAAMAAAREAEALGGGAA